MVASSHSLRVINAVCASIVPAYLLGFVGLTAEIYSMRPQINADLLRSAAAQRNVYFSATALEADPPKLLRTVIFSGYVSQGNKALKRPLPLFFNVPMNAPVEVT